LFKNESKEEVCKKRSILVPVCCCNNDATDSLTMKMKEFSEDIRRREGRKDRKEQVGNQS